VRPGHTGIQPSVQHVDALIGQECVLPVIRQVQEQEVFPARGLVEELDIRIGRSGTLS
jgi:hypothetical protein